jgi:ferritin-like metal-binding protein YciE
VPPTLSNPRDLFLQLLGELLWVERTLAFELLPELERSARSEVLAEVLQGHLAETKEHASRLEQVFRTVGAEPSSNLCPPVEKLGEHHDELAQNVKEERLRDLFHAVSAAATEHYEIASYDALLTLGDALELGDARALLEQNREEEERALKRLLDEQRRLVGILAERP